MQLGRILVILSFLIFSTLTAYGVYLTANSIHDSPTKLLLDVRTRSRQAAAA